MWSWCSNSSAADGGVVEVGKLPGIDGDRISRVFWVRALRDAVSIVEQFGINAVQYCAMEGAVRVI